MPPACHPRRKAPIFPDPSQPTAPLQGNEGPMTPVQTQTLQQLAAEAAARYTAANPLSRTRFERSTGFLPGGDTRTVNHYTPFPVTIVRGAGARLYDLDGHEYVDFLNDHTAGLYGHSHPVLQAAIASAAQNGLALGGPTPNQQDFAEMVCRRFPSVERVRFTNSGTEANLMAVSLARAATQRDAVLVFDGGYHGGPLSFSGPDRRLNLPFPWIVGEYNDAGSARSLIEAHGDKLACVLVEPMLGGGGCIPGTRAFLSALRDATQGSGALLVFDEVQTSRLAPGGLQEALGIRAHLTTFGKYLGGGASFGAFGGRADLMDRFDPRRPDHFGHAGTHNNNALTMAAGLAGLREVLTPSAVHRLNHRGKALRDALNDVATRLNAPAQVTGRGSIMNVHFQRTSIRCHADTAATPQAARDLFHLEMLLAGFWIARRGFISMSLAHDDEDCHELARAFETFLERHQAAIDGHP